MRFAPLAVGLACAAVLFSGLDRVGLLDQREARDAVVVAELFQRREVLTPLYGHVERLEKPILGYALQAAGALLTQGDILGPRLLAALCGAALVLLTAMIGGRHFGPRAGWLSGTVLATSLILPVASRTDGSQILSSLASWIGCAGLADALFGHAAGREGRLVVAYGALAAAFLVGGPLAALWPLGATALYLGLSRAPQGWRPLRPLAGLAILAGLGLPWYGAMTERHGLSFLARAPFFPYAGPWLEPWYAGFFRLLAFLVVGFFPWSTLLPGAIRHAASWWRASIERERREERAAHFFVAALAAAMVPMALYPTAPLPAALPAMPAAALLCGRLLDHLFDSPGRVSGSLTVAVRMLALVGTVGGVLLTVVAGRIPEAARELRALGALVFLLSWGPFLADFMGRRRAAAALLALPVALGAPMVSTLLLPAMESYLNTRAVAEAMEAAAPGGAALILPTPPPPSLRYYLRRNFVVGDPLAEAIEAYRSPDGLAYVAFPPSGESAVARAAHGPLEILIRTPSLVLARVHM